MVKLKVRQYEEDSEGWQRGTLMDRYRGKYGEGQREGGREEGGGAEADRQHPQKDPIQTEARGLGNRNQRKKS